MFVRCTNYPVYKAKAIIKILHIWNTAGVASVISKFMDKLYGTESLVVMRKRFDPCGLTTYGELWTCSGKIFALKVLLKARNYDLIHVHGQDRIVPLLKVICRKPVILHYHGTDIRTKTKSRKKFWKKADKLLVSTPDLLQYLPQATYVPNAPDTDLFYPIEERHRKNLALSMPKHINSKVAFEVAKQKNLLLTIYEEGFVPHAKMASLLNEYEYYIDVKTTGYALSKTAIEALACGLKVVKADGKVFSRLPNNHKPENVCKKLYEIYNDLLQLKSKR